MAEILLDTDHLPLVLVRFPATTSPEQVHGLFERYAQLSRRHARLAYLIDFRELNPIFAPADIRKAAADAFERHRDVLMPTTVAEARIVPNAIMRAGLSAFDAVSSRKWPCANFGEAREALAWLEARLAEDAAKRPKR
jgi:hypothetical protein